ncbi:MAG TPA: ester cyclase [Silvibacterium sp.]|nr:ester cyclase [Silvibacterium sp.]
MSNREILFRALECFGDPARRGNYFDLYSEHIELHGYAGVGPGLANVKAYYEAFWSAFPDANVKVEDLLEEGNKISLRFLLTGTHRGQFLNLPPTGRSISVPGMTIVQFQNGKCVERWSIADSVLLFTQLGLSTIPGTA